MAKSFGVVNILVSGEPPENGSPQHPYKGAPAVRASVRIGELLASRSDAPRRRSRRCFGLSRRPLEGLVGKPCEVRGTTGAAIVNLADRRAAPALERGSG